MRLRIEMAYAAALPCRIPILVIVTADVAAFDVMLVEVSEVGLTQSEHILELVL